LKYTLVGTTGGDDSDTGDIYRGLDRFGRIKDSYWYDYGSSTDLDRIKYGYDRNGNRTYRENTVAASYSKAFDELYSYDLIDRLKTIDRGDLSTLKDAIANLQFAQDWSLDATGNLCNFREDSDGDATWDLNQQRTSNKVNEITDISETTGPSWVTPAYNRAGNMTSIPKPADPTQSYTATYDPWNRLVKVKEGENEVAEYEYDGAKRRTIKKTYSGGQLDETRHLYYTEPSRWQVVEERVDDSSDSERQFIWGIRYVDDLVERDRDTNGDGALDERLYGMQDANWNLTALSNSDGAVRERLAYSAYGAADILTASFTSRATSSYDWEIRFGGYRWDGSVAAYHVRHRAFHCYLGVWLQRDPVGLTASVNLFEYVRCSPVNSTDPLGQFGMCDVIQSPIVQCACFVVQTVDSIVALIAPFFGAATGGLAYAIGVIMNLLDCVCDGLSLAADYCAGCEVKIGQWIAAFGSCILDFIGIFVPGISMDAQLFTGMLEFFFYALAQGMGGRGILQQTPMLPPGLQSCLALAEQLGIAPPNWLNAEAVA
jgi:RHS repeat-associated protein